MFVYKVFRVHCCVKIDLVLVYLLYEQQGIDLFKMAL